MWNAILRRGPGTVFVNPAMSASSVMITVLRWTTPASWTRNSTEWAACDADDDNDGILDGSDSYPLDTDNDGMLDVNDTHSLDTDNDGLDNADSDGFLDGNDPLPLIYNYADGDLNGSGSVDAADILVAERITLGLETATTVHL